MNINQVNYYFSKLMMTYLSKLGVKYAFVSPGSRNTPISLALSDQKVINTHNIIDERSSAYMALGSYKTNKYPAIIVTTSGTAVANLFPAVIESYMSKTPMIIITADRPKNLVGTGANQTINQNHIFGSYVNKFFDADYYINDFKKKSDILLNENEDISDLNQLVLEAFKIAMGSNGGNKGPVHINIPFEKPLHLENREFINSINSKDIKILDNKINQSVKINYPVVKNISKPIIICTDFSNSEIIKVSEKYNIPIFMECHGLRYGVKSNNIISSYEFICSYIDLKPDLIIRFGRKPISNKLNELLENNKNITHLFSKEKNINDDAKYILNANIEDLSSHLKDSNFGIDISWLNSIIDYQKIIRDYFDIFFKKTREHEGCIINKIVSQLPSNSNLLIGNSSPIRDLDKFSFNQEKHINIFSNRGVSGIDGVISTAIGMSIDKKYINSLIIGDISFYYDMSSLINNRMIPVNLNIFIINNYGGHIFDRLEGLSTEQNYDKYWLTPVKVDIKDIAKSFGCEYKKIDLKSFNQIDNTIEEVNKVRQGIQLVEVEVNSKQHHLVNQQINRQIKDLLS